MMKREWLRGAFVMVAPLVLSGCLSSLPELPGSGGEPETAEPRDAEVTGNLDMGLAALFLGEYDEALRRITPVAEAGDAEAQYRLGTLYEYGGQGVTRDYRQAAQWYRRAAEQGHIDAQTDLGALYSRGGPAWRAMIARPPTIAATCSPG